MWKIKTNGVQLFGYIHTVEYCEVINITLDSSKKKACGHIRICV